MPGEDSLDFEYYLVGIMDNKDFIQFKFVFNKVTATELKANYELTKSRLQSENLKVKKIVIWYKEDGRVWGI
jgi:hypothetical protein